MKRFCLLGVVAAIVFVASTSHDILALKNVTSEQEFNQIIVKNKVVVDFYADWCGPCQRMKTILEQVEQDYPGIVFVKVNIESLGRLAKEYNVKGIPTLIFFKDGRVVGRMVGLRTKQEVVDKIKNIFA